MTGFFDEVKVDIPVYEKQLQLVQVYDKIETFRKKIDVIRNLIIELKSKQLGYPFSNYQGKAVSVSEILSCMGGNSGLTEEYLYSQIQSKSERKYLILTGSTDYTEKVHIHRCEHPKDSAKLISVIEGKPIIHVVRKGKAGSSAYFEKGDYTVTDDAYLLFLKDTPQRTLNNIQNSYELNLKWLFYELKSRFFDYATSSDNGTWNKTKFFAEVKIDIPSYAEQNQITQVYDKLEMLEKRINYLYREIEDLLNKQIAQNL
jgi:hypothetical protein